MSATELAQKRFHPNQIKKINLFLQGWLTTTTTDATRKSNILLALQRIDSRYAAALILRARSRKRGLFPTATTDQQATIR
jgi:hypothetical protein